MIKLMGTNPKTGRKLFSMGISNGNIRKLKEGKPIVVFGPEVGLDHDIMIFWGETEEKMVEMLKPFIGPETVVRDELTNRPRKN